MPLDWEDMGRSVVLFGIQNLPELIGTEAGGAAGGELGATAGAVLGALVGVLWPESGTDVWSQIQAKIEALITERIKDYAVKEVKAALTGLQGVAATYLNVLNDPSSPPVYIREQWVAANMEFEHDEPKF